MIADRSPAGPRISVLMIFYNAADFMVEAIESVLAQDFRGFELILVDDGSTDPSTGIARRYSDGDPDRIRYFEHPGHANRGMSASRNLGMERARGEFIAFIDADDRWKPEKLAGQLAIFDRFPQVDAVAGTVNYWRSWDGGEDRFVPTGHVQDRPVPPPQAALSLYPLGSAAAPCPSDLMIRRTAALAVGGFEESFTGPLQMYEDQAFLAKIYVSSTVYFAGRHWLDYRIHGNSCVARVSRDGGYGAVRKHFLDWFSDYLERQGKDAPASVKRAVRRARFLHLAAPVKQLALQAARKVRQRRTAAGRQR